MSEYRFVDPGAIERVPLRQGGGVALALLRWGSSDEPANWGFEHVCKEWEDDQEPDGWFVKIVAPRIALHTVTRTAVGITVRASILCPDCGLHGFITDNRWSPA